MKLSISTLVIATCLLSATARITLQEIHEKSAKGLHLIDLSEDAEPVWKTDEQVLELISKNVGFVRSFRFLLILLLVNVRLKYLV